MFNRIESLWGQMRACALLAVIGVFFSSTCFGFAPILDIKLPSREQEQLEQKERDRRGEKAVAKINSYNESKKRNEEQKQDQNSNNNSQSYDPESSGPNEPTKADHQDAANYFNDHGA
jgi:hypothetical protein